MKPCKQQVKEDKLLPLAIPQPTFASIFNSSFDTGKLQAEGSSPSSVTSQPTFTSILNSSSDMGNNSSSDTSESEESTLGACDNQSASTLCHKYIEERLPADELRIEVMALALKFPNGISSDRWEMLYNIRVKKFLTIPGLKNLVNEALFKHNKLVVKPEFNRFHCSLWSFKIRYPPPEAAQHVRHLVFQIGTMPTYHDGKFLHGLGVYMAWLQKLSNREMGFGKLDTVTIMFKLETDSTPHQMAEFIAALEALPSGITIPCKQLIIDASSHGAWRRISARLTAIDPN